MIGLALAVCVVVGVTWLAAPRRVDRSIAVAAAVTVPPPPVPVATVAPTPIPAPVATAAPVPAVERVKVAHSLGAGVNLRAKAGEKAPRLKTMPEGAVLEIVGEDQTADGLVWRNVRDATGSSGWMAGRFLARVQP